MRLAKHFLGNDGAQKIARDSFHEVGPKRLLDKLGRKCMFA